MAHLVQPTSRDLVITFVKGEGILLKFWGLPVNSLDIVKKFETQFAKAGFDLEQTSGFLNSNQTPVGFKGAVISKFKHQWCRARVLQVRGYNELLVQLLDYGNEEIVSVGDIRNLDDSYFRLSPQALECILADVIPSYPNEWSPEAIRFCEQQLICQTVSCCIVSQHLRRLTNDIVEKVPIVRIAKKGEKDPFVQRLINSGLAYIKPEIQHHQVQQPPVHTQQISSYKMNMLDPNTTHLVRISFIESAQKFFVQLAAAELELKKLMEQIKIYISTETMSLLHAPLVNTPCLAQFSSKQVFYRAVITAVVEGRCSVLFVDFGCSELKDFQELRSLPNRFLGLQAQAICCSLKPGDTSSEKCFKPSKPGELILLNLHVLGFYNEAFVVRLTPYEAELPMRLRPAAVTPPPPMFYRRQTLDVGNYYDVTVSFINDVSEFYCQLTHFKDHLDGLSSHLNGDFFEGIVLSECIPNTSVCVKYSEDDVWYRAQVIKVNHEHDVEVFFVDFGNYDNAYLKNIRKLKAEFMTLPVQAFKCCLFETESPTDSNLRDDMFAIFEELTASQVLKAQVRAVTDGQCYVVTLQEPNAAISINEKIQMKFSTINTVPISDVELLCITSFTSPDLFFAQFVKLSDDKLDQMQEQINEFYLARRNTSFRPAVGSYVCAKYALDGQFYRAVVESVHGMQCEVFFVDYGNREVVAVPELHPMQKEFMVNPQFGIECGLETFPPATPVEKLKILMEGACIQARMVKEETKKWIIALTEDYPKNVAILEFLRQHEMLVPRSIHGAGLRGFQGNAREDTYPAENTGRNGYQSSTGFDSMPSQSNENLIGDARKDSQLSNQSFDVMSIPLNAYRNVCVSYVVSPSEFYVQIEEESIKLDSLMKEIEDSYRNNNNEELNFVKLTVDAPCCAMFEGDEAWYRGQIKEVGANECSVYFIDYGNTDSVFTSKVKVLQRQFFGLPPQALCCKSHNVSPKNGTWSDADIDTFSDMTLEKSFVAQFVESDGNGVYSVNLVSPSKLQEDVLNKEFASLVQGRSEPKPLSRQPVAQEVKAIPPEIKPKRDPHIAAPSNLRLQPPRVRVGSREDIVVPYGLNPGEVFCQLKTTERDFKQMMFNLQSYYNKVSATEAMIDNPHQNMVCIAQFVQDLVWYRAEIRDIDRNSLTVCYIDYGNCETVDKQKVRSITQEFASLPVQGIKCRLKGIRPPGQSWPMNQNIGKYFEGESQCNFIEKDGDCFIVDILCNNGSVAQQLVRDGLAASNAPASTPAASNAPIAKQSLSNQSKTKQSIPRRETGFVHGQLLSVAVSFVNSPYRFWCQLLDEAESLEQLMADIEVQYLESENLLIDAADLAVGFYCMAKYSADEAWYRAQIKSCASAGEYEVFFIDYGNSEVTSSNQLASIHQEFLTLPPQCFECRLHRAPPICDAKIVEDFQTVVNEVEELTAKVEVVANDVCVLTLLYEKGADEVNISDELFGEATPVETAKFPNPDIPLGPKEGYVTEVITPREFFIQLAGIEDDLDDLSTRLSDECETGATSGNEEVLQNPTIGCACSAKYAEDNNWYRAEVIGVQETTANVLFVDYGNTNNVPKDSLRVLSQSFLDVPPYAIKCKLNGIVPPGDQWADSAISSFSDMVLDSALGITFISKDVPATVNIIKDDKDVAQSLVDLELASVETCPETEEAYVDDHLTAVEDNLHSLPSDLSYPKRKLLSAWLPVKICYVDSYSKFYCMPLELSTELDTVMKTLEILYSPSAEANSSSPSLLSPLEEPAVSMACVAKYNEDENWYRAVITEIDGENVYVTFVDYGNSELTTLENLRPLTPELIKIPPIAVECRLYGVQAVEGNEQPMTDKLENLYVDEVEVEMEVVLTEAVYSVKLHHDGDLSDFFTKEGLAVVVIPPSESVNKLLIENIKEKVKENLKTAFVELPEEPKSFIPLQTVSLDEDLLVSVKFSEIENEVLVLYGVPNDSEDSLGKFQDNLQVAYNQMEERVESVACLDFCVAKYAEDEMWYRAQVLSSEGDEIKVKFIDYGNSEIVSIDSIGKLLPEFLSEPQFSIKFCLSGCKVRHDKSEELQDKIDEHFYDDPILVKICKYSHSIPAICCIDLICGEINIVELLLKEKLLLHQFTVNPQLNHKFEATVESIVDNVFYILPIQFKEDRDKLQSRLLEVCDASSSAREIDPGRLYATKVEECWSRVAISVINNSTDSALVKCLDYGQDAEIELSKLVLLPEELCHCPLLLQPCLIANVEEAPDVIARQGIEELNGQIFQCEVLNTLPLQFPLEIKISDKDVNAETRTADEDAACQIVGEVSASADILKSIEEDLSAYSDLVSDIEKDPTDKTATEIISNIDISKADDEKVLSIAKGLCAVEEKVQETNSDVYMSEDELEESVLKESAYVCGEEKVEDARNQDSEFEEFQSDEGDAFTEVLKKTDSFVEEMKNLAQDMKKAAGDFASEESLNLNKALGAVDGNNEQSRIDDLIPEGESPADPDSAENELLPLSDQSLEAPRKDSVVENGFENGIESDGPVGNGFGFSDSAGFEMPNVNDSALSQTEDEFKELNPESQYPESEAVNCLLETDEGSSRVTVSEANDRLEEEASCFPESEELASLSYIESTESDKLESMDNIECTESDNLENLGNIESAESDKLENFDNIESAESDKLENFDTIESTESDKVESLDNVETTESDNLENIESTESDKLESMDNIECTESDNLENLDNIESAESDKLENFDNIESAESDKLENFDNIESTESDKVESLDNVETTESENLENIESTESDKLENFDNIESAESDKLENFDNIESTESDKVESLDNVETTESDNLENLDNIESTESDKVESLDNVETTESDKLENLDNIESAESDKLENPSNIQSTGDCKDIYTDYEDIPETKSDDMDSVEDLVESSKQEQTQRGLAVEDNEWDERPECDIKPERVIEDSVRGDNVPKQKTAIHDGLLGDLIGTSWHKSYGMLKASVTDVSILDGSIVVKIEPSPEELGSVLFGTYKDVYDMKDRDFPDPSVSNLCAVNFNNDWYRAKITDIKEDTLTVSLIDVGTTETVERSAVKDLDVVHRAPLISAQCTLASVYCLPEKSSTTKDFINSLLKDDSKQTFVELVEASHPTNVKINLLLDGNNILYKLLPEKTVIQKVSPATIASGQHSAKLAYFGTRSDLHVHLVSQLEDLQKLRVSMQGAYPSGTEVPIVESGVYALKHNGAWVRGEAVSSEQGLVLRLVDVGETTHAVSELYPLLPEHCRHPMYAVPCKISLEMLAGDVDLEKVKDVLCASEFVVNIEADSSGITACVMDGNFVKKVSCSD